MTIPEHALGVAKELARRFGPPMLSSEESRRMFFRKVAEQVAFERRGADQVGVKRSAAGHQTCKDCVAWIAADGLHAVDLQNGSSGAIELVAEHHIPDQVFVPVTPTNHLGVDHQPPPPPPPPPLDEVDVEQFFADVARIADGLLAIGTTLEAIGKSFDQLVARGVLLRLRQ